MFKYGIGEIVLFESDNEIVDHWLPALGAANITSVVGNLTDRTETNHKLATIIDLNVHGQVPIADSQPFFDAGQPIFLSDELELCFTNTKTSVKAPLKSSSTLKQLAGKSLGIKLDLCFQKSVSGRAIKVAGKQAFCGSVPIVFRCLLDASTPCSEVYQNLEISLQNHLDYLKHSLEKRPPNEPKVYNIFSSKSYLPLNILADSSLNVGHILSNLSISDPVTSQSQSGELPFLPEPSLSVICNPHEALNPPNLPIVRYTKYRYGYYHYGQQGKNDSGWGCAYRSLQTLHSWYFFNSATTVPPPSHQQIQETLVKIGDKQKDFIGSRQWIGSFEVQFVLNELLNATCRSINVSSGTELESRIPELIDHFESVGSPVMIGGGVLAHTIVGVAWDDATRQGKFLILDPHFTGQHNINAIKGKGVYWKGGDFWDEKAYYNMCLPLQLN